MRARVVIGANWGDEGKGLVTDYLATPGSVVVRFNGGAQAGHTVVRPDGRRHVFHHFGSGTFAGANTFLSRFFIVNPILYLQEQVELADKISSMPEFSDSAERWRPTAMADFRCLVTTPYDMMLNAAAEAKRGDKRHGSCGLGINETVHRSGHPSGKYQLSLAHLCDDLYSPVGVELEDLLVRIRREYVPTRAAELGLSLADLPHLNSEGLLQHYLDDCAAMMRTVAATSIDAVMEYEDVIFEGAQGLALDQDSPDFPHVTRSKTGLPNVLELCREIRATSGSEILAKDLELFYVTRAYATRHGRGPLKHERTLEEMGRLGFHNLVDQTNVYNPHQETLRYGVLDVDAMCDRIRLDLNGLDAMRHVVITCADQCPHLVPMIAGDQLSDFKPSALRSFIRDEIGAHLMASYGPTSKTIVPLQERT